jgi:glycosyltransferase involved in cell wall biosynthesis
MNICIIIPAYNEEQSISATITEYSQVFPNARIVVVNNNSTDGTADKAREVLDPVRDLLITELRQGKGFAVKTAISRLDADIYIMTDADATYPACDAKLMVSEMLKTRADMLVGDRISGGAYREQNTRVGHSWGNQFLTTLISYFAGQRYNDVLSGLRIMSRPYVNIIDIRSSGFQLETELNVIAAYIKANVIEMPIQYRQRCSGSQSKLNTISDGLKILGFAFTNWLLFAPLQPFFILAILMGTFSGVLSYRVISGFLETGWPYTTTATAAVATSLIGVLSLFFGLTLNLLVANSRRKEVAEFLELKRLWNAKLDASDM